MLWRLYKLRDLFVSLSILRVIMWSDSITTDTHANVDLRQPPQSTNSSCQTPTSSILRTDMFKNLFTAYGAPAYPFYTDRCALDHQKQKVPDNPTLRFPSHFFPSYQTVDRWTLHS